MGWHRWGGPRWYELALEWLIVGLVLASVCAVVSAFVEGGP